ncbi:MAG: LPP20 family lipoprotein [Pontiellaceae bacterium]|nr:LPP20 family lipoprotein [Pontiellaceae bacterium]
MKRSILGVLSLAVCMGLAGCKSAPPADSDNTIFDDMQKRVSELNQEGNLAAVGIGKSRQQDMAFGRARINARAELARSIQTKIEDLQKSFAEEIGEPENSEINQMFSSATKQITSETLVGSVPIDQRYDEQDGMINAYVLMIQNPAIIDRVIKNNSAQHLYERFRASKAFEELDKEIAEFEKQDMRGFE